MPKITSHRITKDGFEYELDIDFKDAAIMDNQVSFDISARKREIGEPNWQEISLNIDFEFEAMRAIITFEGREIGHVDLSKIDIPEYAPAEQAWDVICEAYSGSPIEKAIQAIPTDPSIGCLIKAGVSTTVGQTMECYNESYSEDDRLYQRIKQTIKCLGHNSISMILTASARTLRCIVMLGCDVLP